MDMNKNKIIRIAKKIVAMDIGNAEISVKAEYNKDSAEISLRITNKFSKDHYSLGEIKEVLDERQLDSTSVRYINMFKKELDFIKDVYCFYQYCGISLRKHGFYRNLLFSIKFKSGEEECEKKLNEFFKKKRMNIE